LEGPSSNGSAAYQRRKFLLVDEAELDGEKVKVLEARIDVWLRADFYRTPTPSTARGGA